MRQENKSNGPAPKPKRATGPRSKSGIARSAQNALAHGLCSSRPVIPGESPEAWDTHRAGCLATLRPVGALEESLAERVAVCLWRLRRLVAYETAVTSVDLEEVADTTGPVGNPDPETDLIRLTAKKLQKAETNLSKTLARLAEVEAMLALLTRLAAPDGDGSVAPGIAGQLLDHLLEVLLEVNERSSFTFDDPAFLTRIGVPPEFHDRSDEWPGWTLGLLRQAANAAANAFKVTLKFLIEEALTNKLDSQKSNAAEVARLTAEVGDHKPRLENLTRRALIRRTIPGPETLDKLTRYEAHLSRQMLQSLHTLERLQASRAGGVVSPPVVIDVNVDTPPVPSVGAV